MPGLATLLDGASGLLQIPALAVIVFILLYAGVVLPAVWSARPARRAAAAAGLPHNLDQLRRSR
jgi:Flp pilus assembly protein TadB